MSCSNFGGLVKKGYHNWSKRSTWITKPSDKFIPTLGWTWSKINSSQSNVTRNLRVTTSSNCKEQSSGYKDSGKNLYSTRNQNGSAFKELHKKIKNLYESNSVITKHLLTTKSEVKSKDQKVRDMIKQLNNLSLQNRMMEKDKSSLEYGQTVTLKQIVELTAKLNASAKKYWIERQIGESSISIPGSWR